MSELHELLLRLLSSPPKSFPAMEIFPELCAGDTVRLVDRCPCRGSMGCIAPAVMIMPSTMGTAAMHFMMFLCLTSGWLGGPNRCLARLDEESSGGQDHFLPSALMLTPPGQRLKLPDSPSVQPRCALEHFLGNREILGRDFQIREC